MKRILFASLALAASALLLRAAPAVDSTISAATVYLDRAVVTRTASVVARAPPLLSGGEAALDQTRGCWSLAP